MGKTLPTLFLLLAPLALSFQLTPRLFARQLSTCDAGKVHCGTNGCAPVDATCCPDNGDYCPSTHYCISEGCCERGDICTGVGGTSTVEPGPLETDPASSSSSLPCDPCGGWCCYPGTHCAYVQIAGGWSCFEDQESSSSAPFHTSTRSSGRTGTPSTTATLDYTTSQKISATTRSDTSSSAYVGSATEFGTTVSGTKASGSTAPGAIAPSNTASVNAARSSWVCTFPGEKYIGLTAIIAAGQLMLTSIW